MCALGMFAGEHAPHTNASIMKLDSKNIHASLPESVGGSENSCRPCPSSSSAPLPSSSSIGDGGRVVARLSSIPCCWLCPGGLPACASAVEDV